MRVVCAPNAFKGTLTAAAAADALADGVRLAGVTDVTTVPVADGGDGTLDVLLAAAGSGARVETVEVSGPLREPTIARLGWSAHRTAVVELAEAAGLRLLAGSRLDAPAATTFGVGQLIDHAITQGAERILVGVGGSATTDAGLGLLQALGAEFRDADGRVIPPEDLDIRRVVQADLGGALARIAGVKLLVAVDVDNELYGTTGAARVFAPQKGADAKQVEDLDAGLRHFAGLIEKLVAQPGLARHPGMGAAGGTAFGLAALGASIIPGAALICDECHLDDILDGADLVITGEGKLDSQTLRGKAPAEVARRCQARGIRCVAVAGVVDDPLPELFGSAHALGTGPGDAAASRSRLTEIAAQIVGAEA